MVDWNSLVQALLFALFADLTATLAAVIGPTYDGVVVPALNGPALYPALPLGSAGGGGFLSVAAAFSDYMVVTVVDPAVTFVIVLVGVLYLVRGTVGRIGNRLEGLMPRLLIAVVLSNLTVPVANVLLGVGGATFPAVAQFDGGAWREWENLAGPGEISFSWDNGALAFVLSFVLFLEVLSLALVLAFRDATLAVLLVLLPVFSLLWPIPSLAPLARRAWKLFGELVFLPCVILIPLELAVGSPNAFVLTAFLGLALASPALISTAGTQLGQLGFPNASAAFVGGFQRGFGSLSSAGSAPARGASLAASTPKAPVASGVTGALRTAGGAAFPVSIPLLTGEVLGRGGFHLVRHLHRFGSKHLSALRAGPVRPKGGRE
jgi:hypothetical protein